MHVNVWSHRMQMYLIKNWNMCFVEKDCFMWTAEYCFQHICLVSCHVCSTVYETNTPIICHTSPALWCSDVGMKSISFYQRPKLELILHYENSSDLRPKNVKKWLIRQKLFNQFCSILGCALFDIRYLISPKMKPILLLVYEEIVDIHTYIHTDRGLSAINNIDD